MMNVLRFYLFLTLNLFLSVNLIAQNDTLPEVEMQEIVIGASKTQTKYRELASSVSVLTASGLSRDNVNTINDLSSKIPNFFMPEYGSKLTAPVYIRGIGSRINSPSVGMYVDGVPYFEKSAFVFDFFDIQQIEVLRGPQGTLFGRNTMGGIINILTLSPMDFQGLKVNVSAGNYGNYSGNLGYYKKIGAKFGVSLAGNYNRADGFYTNAYDNTKVDEMQNYGLRNRLIFNDKDIKFENSFAFDRSTQGGYPYAVLDSALMFDSEINYNQKSEYDRDMLSDAFTAKYCTDNFEIQSVSSTQYMYDIQSIDQDFTADSMYFVVQKQTQKLYSEELIIRSKNTKIYSWLFGGYGFIQNLDKHVVVNSYEKNITTDKRHANSTKGYAAFHQSTLKINNFTLTAGLRFDREDDRLFYIYKTKTKTATKFVTSIKYPERSYFQILPKVSANYNLFDNNVYATVAKGYKTGGYNSTFERPEDLTFEPEYSWNYEAGVKSTFANNSIHTDIAVFYIDWLSQQIYQTVPSGRGSMLKNAGISESKGFEFTFTHKPIKQLQLTANYGFTQAKFISFEDTLKDLNYNEMYIPYVPKHTVSGQISFTHNCKFIAIDKIRINLIYRGNGDIYWNEENTDMQKFYNLLDAKISFIKKGFQFDVWGRNLLNTQYHSFYFSALENEYVQTGRPLQFGVNLSLSI